MANFGSSRLAVFQDSELVATGKLIPFPPAVLPRVRASKQRASRSKAPKKSDLEVSFPKLGEIVFHSPLRFGSWRNEEVRRFVEASFSLRAVASVEVDPFLHTAKVSYAPASNAADVLEKLARVYQGNAVGETGASFSPELFRAIPRTQPRLRAFRFGEVISIWEPRLLTVDRLRLRNVCVLSKPHLVERLERALMSLAGVERFDVHLLAGSLSLQFNPQFVQPAHIIAHLDAALCQAPRRAPRPRPGAGLKMASVSLALSAAATFVAPPLLPVGMALMLYTAIPSFQRAFQVLKHERRLNVDVLDSIIFVACSCTGQIFAGAMTAWFLNLGRKLLENTRAQSERMLLQAFGKQAATASVLRDGVEVITALEAIHPGDLVVVHTGEAVPVDGTITKGDAILDQHALTGEAAPAEKTIGDQVYASTLLLAGKIIVAVEKAGHETAASKIGEILASTVAHKLEVQSRGEKLGDQAVVPTLALAALAAGTVGPSSALAVINSEMGTGIRMAAPLGMMTSITLCAQNGILVKDGRALEIMRKVDTVLFDKTGTLTRDKPEVCRIFCCGEHGEEEILECAAAAEQKFSHPIARAILERFALLQRPLPPLEDSAYQIGYGITVALHGRTIHVGSRRFMEQQKIAIPEEVAQEMATLHAEGHSFVSVAIEGKLAGVLELQTSHRPEVEEIIAGLRARGVNHIAIISGDHDQPTRRLAEHLGVDRYFAEVLPQDKAKYVELLQKEGRTVCFIGDGINDSIALKTANVSISLRGASTIATDTAQIVFMEESLGRLCDLIDYSEALERNVSRSWNLITIPNGLCIAGVFLFGFNIWHSVAFNNLSAIAALMNGMRPLQQKAPPERRSAPSGVREQ